MDKITLNNCPSNCDCCLLWGCDSAVAGSLFVVSTIVRVGFMISAGLVM